MTFLHAERASHRGETEKMSITMISLLELVRVQMNKGSASELKELDSFQRKYLAHELEGIDAQSAGAEEWDSVLEAVTGCECVLSGNSEEAKARLLRELMI